MSRFNRSTKGELGRRVWHDGAWRHRPLDLGESPAVALAKAERFAREIRETAETLVEDRGRDNALAWAEHCMVRDPSGGFWREVAEAIRAR